MQCRQQTRMNIRSKLLQINMLRLSFAQGKRFNVNHYVVEFQVFSMKKYG